jgi:cation diffusion facilitator family transporter
MAAGTRKAVYAALAGNLAIAIIKFIAAGITGSSSMLTEGIHSVVDTGNQGLLLYGMHRSKQPADAVHPYGYGRELYFWSFIVALLIFAGGAGISVYEGIIHIQDPEPIARPLVSFGVLGLAMLLEGYSWSVAMREFARVKGGRGWWQALRRSKDPSTFIVLLEDSAALAGLVLAAIFIGLSILLNRPELDGVGSILIGLLLAVIAIVLARESKGLLIGERADPALSEAIRAIAVAEPGVCAVNDIVTIHLAPDQIIVTISLDFNDALQTAAIEAAVMAIEKQVRADHPDVRSVFIRPQSGSTG